MRYYLDTEFDGHGGPLLSLALVREDDESLYIVTTEDAHDPWVIANVLPLMTAHKPDAVVSADLVGGEIAEFIGHDPEPLILADSPVDIGRFCQAISTASGGGYNPCIAPRLMFEVRDLDVYPTRVPGAVQHNAYWDAKALQYTLTPRKDRKRAAP